MARVAVPQGVFNCANAKGETFSLMYNNGIYRVPEGMGVVLPQLYSYSGDEWETMLTFSTGPLALYQAEMKPIPPGC